MLFEKSTSSVVTKGNYTPPQKLLKQVNQQSIVQI